MISLPFIAPNPRYIDSSFDKHNLHFEEPFGFYDIGVESILNNEEYNGAVKQII